MKYKFIFFLLLLTSTISFTQEVKTQKEIIQIPNTHLVKDFNLKTKGKIKPVKVIKSTFIDIGFGFENKNFNYLKKDYSVRTLTFDGNLLKSNINEFQNAFGKPNSFLFYYTYDSNGILKNSQSKSSNAGKLDENDEKNEYNFYKSGFIKETTFIGKTTTNQKYTYQNNTLSYDFANGTTTYHLKDGLVTKSVTYNKSANKTYTKSYKYNSDKFLEFEDGESYKYTYQLNKNNLIEKEITKNYTKHYKHVYDKYGNWIIAYQLSTSDKNYGGKKTKVHLYGSKFSFYIREIKYSNGEVTGGKTPEDKNIKQDLLKARSELYDELINGKKPYVAAKFKYSDLGLPYTELAEDFNLKIGGKNIVPKQINEKQYDQRAKRGSEEFTSKIVREAYKTFDAKTKKIKVFNTVRNNKTTYDNFTYNSAGKLKTYTSKGGYIDTKKTYSYENNGDFSYKTSFNGEVKGTKQDLKKTDYGFITSGLTHQKFYLKNNLLEKTVTSYNSDSPSETFQSYNNNGQLIKKESSFYVTTYVYNSNGDVIIQKETSKSKSDVTTKKYAYKYDKYGNWIISMMLIDISYAQGIPSFPNPTLREITYSNGQKTGTTDINKVENDLIILRKKVKLSNTNTTNQIMTWKKTSKTNFRFYFNNKQTAKITNKYMGNDLLVFDVDDRQLYILENFATTPINKLTKAKKLNIDTKNGYWFKTQKGGVSVYTSNGVYIKESSLYKYAPNQIDVLYQGKNQLNKVILENYKNAEVHKVYPVILYKNYNPKKGNYTTSNSSGKCVRGDCNNGYGEKKFNNGLIAEGFFENGKPNGPMHIYKKGTKDSRFSTFRGNYTNHVGMMYNYYKNRYTEITDLAKQIGVFNDAVEKKSYILNFRNGKVASKTVMTFNSNEGCIAGNCTNGSGVYKYNNGAFYFGTFQNGKRHGFGKLDFKGGNLYIGEFQNGSYHGLGTYVWSDNNYYMGKYKNGKYHGKGVMFYNKDSYNAGTWQNGNFIK